MFKCTLKRGTVWNQKLWCGTLFLHKIRWNKQFLKHSIKQCMLPVLGKINLFSLGRLWDLSFSPLTLWLRARSNQRWQEEELFYSKNFVLDVPLSYAKMRLKSAPQKMNFLMVKSIQKSYALNCSHKCSCTFPHSYALLRHLVFEKNHSSIGKWGVWAKTSKWKIQNFLIY